MSHIRPEDGSRRKLWIVVAIVVVVGGIGAFFLFRPAADRDPLAGVDVTPSEEPLATDEPAPTKDAVKPTGPLTGKCPGGSAALKPKLITAARQAPDGPGDIKSLKFSKGPECDPDGKYAWGKLAARDESGEPLDDLAMVFTLVGGKATVSSFSSGCLKSDGSAKVPPGAQASLGCK